MWFPREEGVQIDTPLLDGGALISVADDDNRALVEIGDAQLAMVGGGIGDVGACLNDDCGNGNWRAWRHIHASN